GTLQPNTRSCGNQPAHISLDHASFHDTLDPTADPHGLDQLSRTPEPDDVLTGIKAKPFGWPTASLDPGSGRRSNRSEREPRSTRPDQ
ncbi:MAG: hypothetical protein ABI384_01090, partial [Allobranchiibius sp.]